MEKNRKGKLVAISELPLMDDQLDGYLPVSQESASGELDTFKISLTALREILASTTNMIYSCATHSNIVVIPINREERSIIYVAGKHLTQLEIQPNESTPTAWTNIPLNTAVDIPLAGYNQDMRVRTTSSSADGYRTIIMERKIK